jgi:hypothetical protein
MELSRSTLVLNQYCSETPLKIFFQQHRPWTDMRGSELLLRKIDHRPLFRRSLFHALMAELKAEYGQVPKAGKGMRRRDFITLIGGLTAWPLAARAQQSVGMRRIGMLMAYGEKDQEGQAFVATFREALAKLGWAEGRSIQIDVRWAPASSNENLRRQFAQELIAFQPDLIVSHATPNTATLHEITHTVPVVFVNVSDPIGSGFVTSFPKPGGNITGFINMEPTMAGKWVELLKEIAPRVTNCALPVAPCARATVLPSPTEPKEHPSSDGFRPSSLVPARYHPS